MKNTLNKQEINTLFEKGKWITTNNIKAVYLLSTSFNYMVSGPKKNFKKAVDRNKIKRHLRATLKKCSKPISIALIYSSKDINSLTLVDKEVEQILASLKV
jgi:ribonuclease P protein component